MRGTLTRPKHLLLLLLRLLRVLVGTSFVLDFFENLWRFTVPGAAQFNGPSPRILSGAIHDRELWVFGGTISLFTEGSAEGREGPVCFHANSSPAC